MAKPKQTAATPTGVSLDFDALEAGDLEDIEEYSGRDDVLALLMRAETAAAAAPEGEDIAALVSVLPTKVFTALLGVNRRRTDPTWTPDRWRSFRLSDTVAPSTNGNGQADRVDPTSAAATPQSTGGASPSGSPPSRPSGTAATTG